MLEKMRVNQADWRIKDVETLCRQAGLHCMPPRGGGSHYRVWSDHLHGVLTIPAHRPIKRPYIMNLVSMADAHLKSAERKNGK